MNDEVLEQVLGEVTSELREMKQDQRMFHLAIESYNRRINEFQDSLRNIKLETPEINLNELNGTINKLLKELKDAIVNQTQKITHEKRILFYPEGDGKNFWKYVTNKVMLYGAISILIFSLFAVTTNFLKANNENARFKCAFFWIYHNQDINSRKFLLKTYKEFENDSIFNLRKDKVKLNFDK